jgi:hypothetical protein
MDVNLSIEPENIGFQLRKKFWEAKLKWHLILRENKTSHLRMKQLWKKNGIPKHPLAIAVVEAYNTYVKYEVDAKGDDEFVEV